MIVSSVKALFNNIFVLLILVTIPFVARALITNGNVNAEKLG